MDGGGSPYSPGRIKLLLWRYDELVHVTKVIAKPAGTDDTQRLPREHGEGGFEDGACIKADLDSAMRAIDPILARVVWDYYVAGYAAVEIAAAIPGVNRWFVDRARHRGVRQMALFLKWVPRHQPPASVAALLDDDATPVRERMRLVVARALSYCPGFGPKGLSCPVIRCRGFFDHQTGAHVGVRILA